MAKPSGDSESKATPRSAVSFNNPMPDWVARYDTNLRIALALIKDQEWDQLAARTGIEWSGQDQSFTFFVELDPIRFNRRKVRMLDLSLFTAFEMILAKAYVDEFARNKALRTLPVRIALKPGNPALTADGTPLDTLLQKISESGHFARMRAAVAHGRCLDWSVGALELPPAGTFAPQALKGKNIVIGIIDDGCGFAHPDFLTIRGRGNNRTYRTRVLALWDQSGPASAADKAIGWADVPHFNYGRELDHVAIDKVIAQHATPLRVDEDAIYAALNYAVGDPLERATHGTKVMGIAAGNGNSLMGTPGVAPLADIIFVQLPRDEIATAPKTLSTHIVEGAQYVFRRAAELNRKAAVVNISYGGYAGPHDGTSAWERHLDELLAETDRAVVVAGGNGFEADCHATGTLNPGATCTLSWVVNDGDTTPNDCEIWYNGDAALLVLLDLPDGSEQLGPFAFLPDTQKLVLQKGQQIGTIQHVANDPDNHDNVIRIELGPTVLTPQANAQVVAPAGTWTIRLSNPGSAGSPAAVFHAWIQRDDFGKDGLRNQSRFAADDPLLHPGWTLGDYSTGELTISVGAYNVATNEVCRYSACGPTRESPANQPARKKPDVCAPAEETGWGGGVLTTASRRANPKRMNGTSASAPHVAGIVALAFDYRRNVKKKHLLAKDLRAALVGDNNIAGQVTELKPNRDAANDNRPIKQKDVWSDLIGDGIISCTKTLAKL